jgi:hypothetical protein
MSIERPLYRSVADCCSSPSGHYRFLLRVFLSPLPGRSLTVILKNPSLADATRADPTVGKVEAWARRHGFYAVTYVNLFAFRSPHPHALNSLDYDDAVGLENDAFLHHALAATDVLVVGWGNPNGIHRDRYEQRITEVCALLRAANAAPHRVGPPTRAGYPRHGLIWRDEMALEPFVLSH